MLNVLVSKVQDLNYESGDGCYVYDWLKEITSFSIAFLLLHCEYLLHQCHQIDMFQWQKKHHCSSFTFSVSRMQTVQSCFKN